MNVSEFEQAQATLACAACGDVGRLFLEENPNNRGIQAKRPNGCSLPIPGQPFLAKNAPKSSRPRSRSGESTDTVWAKWGDRCSCCGTRKEDLQRLKIGIDKNHVPPFVSVEEHETWLLPMCVWCHELFSATQDRVRRIISQALEMRKP